LTNPIEILIQGSLAKPEGWY